MYKTILVPLDGSQVAELALPHAEELAGRLGADITLIHVAETPAAQYDAAINAYIEQVAETTAFNAQKHVGKLVAKKIRVRSAIVLGNAAEEIVDYAETMNADMTVMATHGRSGIKRWTMGSVADKVVRATSRPVMMVRAGEPRPDVREHGAFRSILVPLDGSAESEAVIPHIRSLASGLKAQVALFRVVEPTFNSIVSDGTMVSIPLSPEDMAGMVTDASDYLERIAGSLREDQITVSVEARLGAAAIEIMNLADETAVDLIAMSTHGRSGIQRWVFGSTADKILHGANTPLLLVRVAPKVAEQEAGPSEPA